MIVKICGLASFLSVLFFFSFCKKESNSSTKKNTVAIVESFNQRGRQVFNTNCASCHGLTGKGDGIAARNATWNPRNFMQDAFKNGKDIAGITKTLNEGISRTTMVAWKGILNPEDIRNVAEYVLHLSNK